MKFEDAFAKTLENTPKECMPRGDDNIPKILAFLWSMLAVSKKELDDIAYIDNNKNIVSIPLQKSSKATAGKKSATKKSDDKKPVGVTDDSNGREENTTN